VLPNFAGTQDIADACSGFDPATDAVVPLTMRIASSTEGFSLNAKVSTNVEGGSTAFVQLAVNSTCAIGLSSPLSTWAYTCSLAAKQACSTSAYVILKNYFTPSAPNGTTGAFAQVSLLIGAVLSDSDTFCTVTGATGPGIKTTQGVASPDVVTVPLSD
jgi:hypothetical protein